jgi:hypothetical protein
MSLPGLMAQPVMQAVAQMNPIDAILSSFNTNPYFIGIMMLFLNLGGRFLIMEVSKEQERFFQNPWVRRLLIFTVLFVATRNVLVAFVMTLFVILIIGFLFNENSALYIYSGRSSGGSTDASGNGAGPAMTMEEQDILRRLNEKQMRLKGTSAEADGKKDDEEDVDDTEIYVANLSLLRK